MHALSSSKKTKKLYILIFFVLICAAGIASYIYANRPTEIRTGDITDIPAIGKLSMSDLSSTKPLTALQAKPNESITYESQPLSISINANAAILEWDQDGDIGIETEVRTHNGSSWSPWVNSQHIDGGKDGVEIKKSSTLIIATTIKQVQFRYILKGDVDQPSGKINAESSTIQTLDSSQGPDPTASPNSILDQISQFFGLNNTAQAKVNGPRIFTRAEWGSPEPNSSTWTPEYEPLERAIVHHTVTTENPNPAAAVRAIWHYHAITLGWGDIGYNYLVDSGGNIFQGRYYDKSYAEANKTDVVAGHAYGNNRGTTGIAALGNFDDFNPSAAQIESISNIIGFKLAPYNVNPNNSGRFGAAVVGHRDVYPTACPGQNLYPYLAQIRWRAGEHFGYYNTAHRLDYAHYSQKLSRNGVAVNSSTVLKPSDTVEVSINLKNNGTESWKNSGTYRTTLGTSSPRDRSSVFYDPSWINKNRPATFSTKLNPNTQAETTTNIVAPGEIAVFRFNVKIPDLVSSGALSSKLYKEYFQPVQDGRAWFPRYIGLYQPLSVEKHSYEWQYQIQHLYTSENKMTKAPATLMPNTRYYAYLRIKNTGNATWHQQSFKLGTSNPKDRSSAIYDSTWISKHRPARLTQSQVAPGEIGTFEFWIKTPSYPISQKEYFLPLVENTTWLKDVGLHWVVKTN